MSRDEIKLNYLMAEEMARAFRMAAEALGDLRAEVEAAAGAVDDGALRGRAGTAYATALREQLAPGIGRLAAKLRELEGDMEVAIMSMRQADAEAMRWLDGPPAPADGAGEEE